MTTNNAIIETERLILRHWRESDAEALFKYASDPDVGPVAGWAPHTSVENSLEIIRTVFSNPEVYAVVLKSTSEPIGCCGIVRSDSAGEAEIGYWIGKLFWGRGLIPEAVRGLLFRCFHRLGLHTVWCGYYDGNIKSKRVCEKSGFRYHHTNRDVVSLLGDVRTEHFYSMSKADFDSLR